MAADACILVSFLSVCLPAHMYRPTKAIALASARPKTNWKPICSRVGREKQQQQEEGRRLTIRTLEAGASRLFLLLGLGTLDLGCATEGLLSVLALLACCVIENQSQPTVPA